MSRERRQHPRYACDLSVEVGGHAGTHTLTTRDVSVGGVFLYSKDAVSLDEDLALRFTAGEHDFAVDGQVVHLVAGVGFGVMFTGVDADVADSLRGFLATAEAEAEGLPD